MANVVAYYFNSPRAITAGCRLLLRKSTSNISKVDLLRTVNNESQNVISVTVSSVSEFEGYYRVITDAGLLSVSLVDNICFLR